MSKIDLPQGLDKAENGPELSEWRKVWLENPVAARQQHEAVRGGYSAFQQYYQTIPDVRSKAEIAMRLFEPARAEIEAYLVSRDERKKKDEYSSEFGISDPKGEFTSLMNRLDRLVPYGFPTSWFIWDIEKAHDLEVDGLK